VKIKVLDAQAIGDYVPEDGSICISIGERALPKTRIPDRSYGAVLRLVFDDISQERGGGWILFDEQHARQILGFVREHSDTPALIVQCTFGESRSPGVALGIADALGLEVQSLERRYPEYNRRVRAVLGRTADRDRASHKE